MKKKHIVKKLISLLFILLGLIVVTLPVLAAGSTYTVKLTPSISFNLSNSNFRAMARDSTGRLWAGYLRKIGSFEQFFVSYSDDGGQTWTEEAVHSSVSQAQLTGGIAVDSLDNLHVVWSGKGWGTNTTFSNVQYRKRTSGGWQTQESVTDTAFFQELAAIAIDSQDNIHVVWDGTGWGTNTSESNIQYRKRTSGGWQTQEAVTDVAGGQFEVSIAVDSSDNIHVGWAGSGWGTNTGFSNVQYRKRTSGGWQTQESATDVAFNQTETTIALDSTDNVHVTWVGTGWGTNTTFRNVQYRKRTSGGWQTQEAVTDKNANQDFPSIALDRTDMIHIGWVGRGWGTNTTILNLQYRPRTSGGWGTQEGLTDASSTQNTPNLIWANYPLISGVRTNIPYAGYNLIWDADTAVNFFTSDDISWVTPATSVPASSTGNASSTTTTASTTSTSHLVACGSKPFAAPNLFRIDTTRTTATLYFSPLSSGVTSYVVSFGLSAGDERFSSTVNQSASLGVLSTTVSQLSPGTTYYFKIRAMNDCAPGDWSQELAASTLPRTGQLTTNTTTIPTPTTAPITPTPIATAAAIISASPTETETLPQRLGSILGALIEGKPLYVNPITEYLFSLFPKTLTLVAAGVIASAATYIAYSAVNSLGNTSTKFLQSVGLIPRREQRGLVFDAQTGKPVPFVRILLFDAGDPTKGPIDSVVSDTKGIYQSIKLPPGNYRVEAIHNDYGFPTAFPAHLPSTMYDFYKGQAFSLGKSSEGLVLLIPMDPKSSGALGGMLRAQLVILVSVGRRILRFLFFPLAVFSAIVTFLFPVLTNLILAYIYVLALIGRAIRGANKAIVQGQVQTKDGKALPNTIIRCVQSKTNSLVAILLSDEQGKFATKLPFGDYAFTVNKDGYAIQQESGDYSNVYLKNKRGGSLLDIKMISTQELLAPTMAP